MHSSRMRSARGSSRPRGSASVHTQTPPGVGLETPLARPLSFPLGVDLETTPPDTCKTCWDTTPPLLFPPPPDRILDMLLKILPCPKLRLRAVTI